MADSKLQIVLTAKDEASKKISGLSKSMSGLKSVALSLAPVIGTAVLGKAIADTVRSAADFEQQLSDISTLISGDATKAVEDLKDGIQELAKVTPKDPKELGAAAYQVVSAGISDTTEALKVLKSSTRLATAGLGTTEEATDLLTSALNSFKIPAEDAERAAAVLFNTVKQGKTTVSQLAIGFGQVAPIAAEMGVSLEELSAATAALTTTGLKTSVAQQQLRAAMGSLLKPTADAKELFDELGVKSFKELIKKSGGLVGAFEKLKKASKGNEEQLAKAAGSVEGLGAILSLTGAQADSFTSSLESMQDPVNSLAEAVEKQNETFNAQYIILKNRISVVMQNLALSILPSLIGAMKSLTNGADGSLGVFSKMRSTFSGFFADLEQKTGIITFFKEEWAKVVLVVQQNLLPAVRELFEALQPMLPFLKALATVFGGILLGSIVLVTKAITWAIIILSELFTAAAKVNTFFSKIFVGTLNTIIEVVEKVITSISKLINKFNVLNKLRGIGANISRGFQGVAQALPFANGGIVTKPTMGLVGEAGPEAIIPLNRAGALGGISVNIQGGTFLSQDAAEQMGDLILDKLKTNIRI